MKKQQYIAAVACLVAGAIGFASVYATEKNQEKRNDSDYAIQQESTEQLSAASYEIKPKTDKQAENAPEVEEDKMAAIVEIIPVDQIIILHRVPAAWTNISDCAPFFRRL